MSRPGPQGNAPAADTAGEAGATAAIAPRVIRSLPFKLANRASAVARALQSRWPAPLVPARWAVRPPARLAPRVCLFVMLARDGRLLPHSVDHARAWADAGYDVVAVVVVDSLRREVDWGALGFARAVLVRANTGYDFGAWAATIRRLGKRLAPCETVAIANDSLLGPSRGFAAMLDRAALAEADLVGVSESAQLTPHLQSFALFFRRGALRSRAFRRFWRSVGSGDRADVIARYELRLQSHFAAAGLRTFALFPSGDPGANPTLRHWRELLAQGFPYLKVELLRDNPTGEPLGDWLDEAARHGFDVPRLLQQVDALKRAGGRPWAV